ncbi:putative bifunctional diguanylate cyclase/phosphodiesterase [Paraglaciecola polaris]|uniref:Diguanylate cyclase/phosphodiesterase n=1 Tax=Paraglaciecola polaris LMG 21857 TaxID=1129793 RepID=K6YI32_9ALTE|nr:bifunctional diguanylate cyclase/phosphodiesterase [Paraglaciecola polaris]GAC32374.1 diguanylate cyclase/phosphodiesterase [Paraglaciecola polaris LMG 21857]
MNISLFKALGIIDCCVFKRLDADHYETLYAEHEWIDLLLPQARQEKSFTSPCDSPFLDDFLMQAEEFWEYADYGKIESGIWNEKINDQELKLNAYATMDNGDFYLIIDNVLDLFKQRQKTLQSARELLLSNDKIVAQQEYIHQRLDELLNQSTTLKNIQQPITEVIEKTEVGVAILSPNLQPISQNPALYSVFDTQLAQAETEPYQLILQLFEKQYPEFERVISTGSRWSGELFWLQPPGNGKWLKLAIYPVKTDFQQITHWVFIVNDISQVKHLLQNNEKLTHYDALTDIPNRQYFWMQLEQSVNNAMPFYLLYLDIKNFKRINEIHGHSRGDQIIQELVERIAPHISASDMLARIGGGEFAIIRQKTVTEQQCIDLGHILIETATQPFYLPNGTHCEIGLNIGAASFPRDADDAETLMKFADLAVFNAKKATKSSVQFYSQKLKDASQRIIELENALQNAITNHEFELFLQPMLDLTTGTILKAEALLRWNRLDTEKIGPDEFIPIAEQTGLIVPIGKWVISKACEMISTLNHRGQNCKLSVNLSPRQISDRHLLDFIRTSIKNNHIQPDQLELELTEGVLVDNYDKVQFLLTEVRKLGVSVSIDDFGTGYSSLSYLKKLPIDHIKIDRSFIQDLVNDENDKAIILAIIAMAHSLKLNVIAEGVETELQRNFLQLNHCNLAQGYLFSRPLPFAQFCDYLTTTANQTLIGQSALGPK